MNGLIVFLVAFGGWIVLSVPLGILVAKQIGWRETLFPPREADVEDELAAMLDKDAS